MNRGLYALLISLLGICVIAFVAVGCRHESASSVPTALPRATPEEGFEKVVEIFRDGMEIAGGSSGFVTQDAGAGSRFQVHNTVTSELIAPSKPDEPYRGTITVSSQSIYSFHRQTDDDDKKDHKKNNDQPANGPNQSSTLGNSDSDFKSFNQSVVSDPSQDDKGSSDGTPAVERRPDNVDRTYQLVYQGGRWELVTKLDPKTEASVQHAFERAFRLQP
jgi:hypothetical protein